ncbi:MAG TPA: gamma-glutamyltransferase family protein [Candidatus Limnocylindrales bacterium]|nr:gamma-glutamyltransferase family protein [Candidatus Limnocylindrales bacterium]
MSEHESAGGVPLVPARLVRGARGAVVAPHHLATQAGLSVLAAGGSAVDAAIATNAVLGVVMPNGCGIGGDAFWLVWDEAAGEQVALNGSGRAPLETDADALRASGRTRLPLRGPMSITVPGAVRSWGDAHRRWGRLSWETVLAPAIEQAEDGFPAWDGLVRAVEGLAAEIGDEPWARGFLRTWRASDREWRPGERVRLPALARTLHTLADEGFDAYYDGDLGERIVRGLNAAGAPFTLADLREHRSTWGRPIETTYRGVRVTTHPPNSSGVIALEILNVLERFTPAPGAAFGAHGWTDPAWIHLQLEAAKLAFADRDAELTDPEAREIPVDRLLAKDRAAELAARIDPRRADPAPPPARTLVGGTIYLAVVDGEGNAVSLIQSNAAGFGSGVLDQATGIHFQDRGASFSLDPAHPNVIAPGKRTAHTLLPGMLFRDGERRPWVVGGSMGGDIQPQIHVQLVSALMDGGADIRTAVAAPRVVLEPAGWFAPPTAVLADGDLATGVEAGLRALGHGLARTGYDGGLGHEHAIELVDGGPAADGTLAAVADPRSMGLAAVR